MKNEASNRECANCEYPCQGGEVLHRYLGPCCHDYCSCEGFVELEWPRWSPWNPRSPYDTLRTRVVHEGIYVKQQSGPA